MYGNQFYFLHYINKSIHSCLLLNNTLLFRCWLDNKTVVSYDWMEIIRGSLALIVTNQLFRNDCVAWIDVGFSFSWRHFCFVSTFFSITLTLIFAIIHRNYFNPHDGGFWQNTYSIQVFRIMWNAKMYWKILCLL